MPPTTLLDIVKRRGSDREVGMVDETIRSIPELTKGAARLIKGINFKTLVRTSLPTVGFRNANEGTAATKGKIENRLVEAYLSNPRWECDKAVADVNEDGPELLIADEGVTMVTAAMQAIASQFYYGLTLDPNKGFPGLGAAIDASMVLDATGTTANGCASLWGVRWGRQDVEWVWGLGAEFKMSDVTLQRVLDAGGNPYTAYCQELWARPGVKVASKFSIAKIKNLTLQAGHTLNDALVFQLLTKFPAQRPPDMWLTTKAQLEQLRKSRTATNATGAAAPTPTEVAGIPIFASESLLDTEAVS